MNTSRVTRVRCCWVFVFLSTMMLPGADAQTSPPPDIRALMEQLTNPREVRANTVQQIVVLSKKDSSAREFVIQRLPDLIRGPESDLWLDAMRIAGELKAKEAIPALQDVLSRPPRSAEAFMTFSGTTRLDNDIVARTLAEIGDPSIPTARNLLKSKENSTRWRAILILRNIGSPTARKVLRDHLPRETDVENRKLIEDSLYPETS